MDIPKKKMTTRLLRTIPLLLIFAAGIVTGYSLSLIKDSSVKLPVRPDMNGRGERTMGKLCEALGLTPEQEQHLRGIMRETFRNLAEIREDARPLIKAEIDSMDSKIRAMLDAEQQTEWDRLLKRFKNAVMRPEHGRMWNHKKRHSPDNSDGENMFDRRKLPPPRVEEPPELP